MRRINRGKATRAPVARIVVVTEGASTEPSYLNAFHKMYGHRFSTKIVPIGGVGDPKSVVERAIKETEKIQRDRLGMQDSVWAMFDRDNHPQFKLAKQIAFRNKICVAVSNPCFEVWCILHYRDYDAPSSCDQCQRDLEQLCKNYDRRKGKLFADERNIKNGYCRAVERAMKLLERRNMEGHPDGNPSTSVHEITEHIRLFRKT